MQAALPKAHTIEGSIEAVLFARALSNKLLFPEVLRGGLCRTVHYSGHLEIWPQAMSSGCVQ